jgi:hypothetical protein
VDQPLDGIRQGGSILWWNEEASHLIVDQLWDATNTAGNDW